MSATLKEEVIKNFLKYNISNERVIFKIHVDMNEDTSRLFKNISNYSKFQTEE